MVQAQTLFTKLLWILTCNLFASLANCSGQSTYQNCNIVGQYCSQKNIWFDSKRYGIPVSKDIRHLYTAGFELVESQTSTESNCNNLMIWILFEHCFRKLLSLSKSHFVPNIFFCFIMKTTWVSDPSPVVGGGEVHPK